MKASRLLITALSLGLCTVATSAWAQSDSSYPERQAPAQADSAASSQAPDRAADPQDLQQPDAAPQAQQMAPPPPAPMPPAQAQQMAPPPPRPAPPVAQQPAANRAHYDSSTDRSFYDDGTAVRSGTTSSDEQGATYVAPKKDATPRVHDMNRPTQVDSPSGTTAPAMGRETDSRAQAPLNGFLVDAGVGAGFGMHAPGAVWGLGSEYSFAVVGTPQRLAFKGLFDVNFGYGTDLTQFLSIGGGANWYLGDFLGTETNRAYISGDVSIGDATNAVTGHTTTGAVLGVGASYTFAHTAQADFNGMIHYAVMLNTLDSSTPSILTFRVGMAF